MLTHVSAYDEVWTRVSDEQRLEAQAWLIAHDQNPHQVHTVTLHFEGESATALIEGYVWDEQRRLVPSPGNRPGCTHAHPSCTCEVEQFFTQVRCKTLPPFTRWTEE